MTQEKPFISYSQGEPPAPVRLHHHHHRHHGRSEARTDRAHSDTASCFSQRRNQDTLSTHTQDYPTDSRSPSPCGVLSVADKNESSPSHRRCQHQTRNLFAPPPLGTGGFQNLPIPARYASVSDFERDSVFNLAATPPARRQSTFAQRDPLKGMVIVDPGDALVPEHFNVHSLPENFYAPHPYEKAGYPSTYPPPAHVGYHTFPKQQNLGFCQQDLRPRRSSDPDASPTHSSSYTEHSTTTPKPHPKKLIHSVSGSSIAVAPKDSSIKESNSSPNLSKRPALLPSLSTSPKMGIVANNHVQEHYDS